MTAALLVMTDGRVDCLTRTIDSAVENLYGDIGPKVIHNDSPDPLFRNWLHESYGELFAIVHTPKRAGFGGAIRNAWAYLQDLQFDHLIHLEDDFVWNRPVALEYVTALLEEDRSIAQVAFRRQPWNDDERKAGGVVEQHPHAYIDCVSNLGCPYLTQRFFWTTNPSVYRRAVLDADWPTGQHSEGFFTHKLLREGFDSISGDKVKFAYWGARESEPWVEHIGHQRAGVGY